MRTTLTSATSLCPIASRGVYDIFVQKDGVSLRVGKYDNKGSFGELALMYNTPRAATIVATEDGALWGLVSLTFAGLCTAQHLTQCLKQAVLFLVAALSGSSHISQADCEKQREEEEDVRGLHRMRSSSEVS